MDNTDSVQWATLAEQQQEEVCAYKRCLKPTLNLEGRVCMSFTRRLRPMRVAMLQCCTVGVNCTLRNHEKLQPLPLKMQRGIKSPCRDCHALSIKEAVSESPIAPCTGELFVSNSRAWCAEERLSPDQTLVILHCDVVLADHLELL